MESQICLPRTEGSQVLLENLCRMCACKVDKAIPIFGDEGTQHELAVKLQTHLPIKVSESDSLPKQLCHDCTSLLIQWDAALVGSLAADRKLRALQWKQQQAALAKQKESEIALQSKHETSGNGSKESLCCSICNESGMDFRKLVLHLKTHESTIPFGNDTESAHSGNSGLDDSCENENLQNSPQLSSRGKNQPKSKEKQGCDKGASEQVIPEINQNGEDSVKNRLRKRKPKLNSSEIFKGRGRETGSGDPQVTSSTGTPPIKVADVSSFADLRLTSDLNSSSQHGQKCEALKRPSCPENSPQKAQNQLQDGLSKPKVRIISAESINLSLEQRAKANLNAKPAKSVDAVHASAVLSISGEANSVKTPSSSVFHKNKIIISGDILRQINSSKSRTGPKLLRLKDGRLVRILDAPPTVSPLSNSLQRIYRPIQPCPPADGPLSSKTLPQGVIIKTNPMLSGISNIVTISDKNISGESGNTSHTVNIHEKSPPKESSNPSRIIAIFNKNISDEQCNTSHPASISDKRLSGENSITPHTISISDTHLSSEPIETSQTSPKDQSVSLPICSADGAMVDIKLEPAEGISSPPLQPAEKRMVNVSFYPQPGPKNSVPRFTCFQCGKRNLLHDSLHAHAQLHAPDKAVLNAVSVPRSFSPVVASSIIRVVSSELKNQNITPPFGIRKAGKVSPKLQI